MALGIKDMKALHRKKKTKFRNVKTRHVSPVIGDKEFDSKWEAELCRMLDFMVKAGEIRTFIDQSRIVFPAESQAGKRRVMSVDFLIIDLFGRAHYWDAKGVPTSDWEIKRDLALDHHGINVIPVKKGKGLPNIYTEDELATIKKQKGL